MSYYVQVHGPNGWESFLSNVSLDEATHTLRIVNDDDPRPFCIRDVNGIVVLRGKWEVEAAPSLKTPRPPDYWIVGRVTPSDSYRTEETALDAARKRSSEIGGPYYVYRATAVLAVGFVEERFEP